MSQFETARAVPNEVELCALTETRNGQIYSLAPSFFSEGPSTESRKDLKNYKEAGSKPRRIQFAFTKPRHEKVWVTCTYRKNADHFEKVTEVQYLVTTCEQVMKANAPEIVDSFKCKYRTLSM